MTRGPGHSASNSSTYGVAIADSVCNSDHTWQTVLVAEAHEVKQGRRAGFYQMSVATEDGLAVARADAVAHRPTS